MVKQVVDASAVLAVLFGEKHRAPIIEAAQKAELLSAASLPWEIGNALVANCRRGRLDEEAAREALLRFDDVLVRLINVPLKTSLSIALQEGIYAYDAYYLTLCHRHSAALVSVDLRLRRVARKRGIELLPLIIEGDERFE